MSISDHNIPQVLSLEKEELGNWVSPNYFMKYCKNFIALKRVAQTGLCDMFCEHMFDHGVFSFLAGEIYQIYAVISVNYVLRLLK